MQENSTQLQSESTKNEVKTTVKKSTVDFLKQFARSYSYNKDLQELGEFFAN